MALTQVSTGGVKDDAITKAKIPANQIEASELADGAVSNAKIASGAVGTNKLASGAVGSGEIAAGSILNSNISSSAAIAGSKLADNTITTAKIADDAITQAKINVPIINRNLIINGAMQVAQRSTSSTSVGYQTVDRIQTFTNGVDEAPTFAQVDVSSGTSPYTEGFRKAFKVTNGNQTGGAGAADYIIFRHKIEAQNVSNSGWNYTSTSSFVTLSFWVKASVAQNYYFSLLSSDGTLQNFPMETGSLTANTWTKITKTIPGAANVQFDNDNGIGIELDWWPFAGTDYTADGVALNTWAAFAAGTRFPNHTSTWYTTNDATFEITGVQLEVGSVATDFEHRSFAQELTLCQRYFQKYVNPCCTGVIPDNGSKAYSIGLQFQTRMRAAPTLTTVNAGDGQNISDGQNSVNISSLNAADRNVDGASIYLNLASDLGDFRPACLGRNDSTTHTTTYKFSAEL